MYENKVLNNGETAIFKGVDVWCNSLYQIPFKSNALKSNTFMAVEVDGILHTIDEGEPSNKILHELQFIGVSREDVYSDAGNLK